MIVNEAVLDRIPMILFLPLPRLERAPKRLLSQ